MEVTAETISGLVTALGVGLLIGLERERRKRDGVDRAAGVRTFSFITLAGALAYLLGDIPLLTTGLAVGVLAVVSYLRTADDDPGLTSEIAILISFLLGVLAMEEPALAAGLGVVVAVLLALRGRLHRFSREVLSTDEVHDLLLLAGAALVVLPLLPDRTVDPWGVLNPSAVWRFVVLVMGVGAAGHVALRMVGARRGLPLAGFFAGFASSTAAVAGFGQQSKDAPALLRPAVAAALLANLASLLLFVAVVGAGAPELLAEAWPTLLGACVVLLGAALVGLFRLAGTDRHGSQGAVPEHAFKVSHALALGAVITVVLLLSGWLQQLVGDAGALAAAALAAMVELHGAAATVTQLAATGSLSVSSASWGLVALLAASSVVKSVLAFTAGGRRYGLGVTAGLTAMVLAAAALTVV
jgi:uncharacterized membrane protein (DUF4010 family)